MYLSQTSSTYGFWSTFSSNIKSWSVISLSIFIRDDTIKLCFDELVTFLIDVFLFRKKKSLENGSTFSLLKIYAKQHSNTAAVKQKKKKKKEVRVLRVNAIDKPRSLRPSKPGSSALQKNLVKLIRW